ncbi:hypothetical protein CK203_015718 [Vitis vinifera]|uniref:Uncharacterized protein n=1 Tax=Vitis vinifera TaxID=29760 RepID=A0A438J4Y7_VITVI|nr:hypothetical protein CK203_015718 [Vitis vinifera]
MEPETRRRIEKTVLEILKSADMDEMTESSRPSFSPPKNLDGNRNRNREPDRKKANTEAAEREPTEEEEEERWRRIEERVVVLRSTTMTAISLSVEVVELSRVELGWLRVVLHGYGLRIRLCLGLEKSEDNGN